MFLAVLEFFALNLFRVEAVQNILDTVPISSIVFTFQAIPDCQLYPLNCPDNSTEVTWWGSNTSPDNLVVLPSYWTEARRSLVTYRTEVIGQVIDISNISIAVTSQVRGANGSPLRSDECNKDVILDDLVTIRLLARSDFVFWISKNDSKTFVNVTLLTGTPVYIGLMKSQNEVTNMTQFVRDVRFLPLNSSLDLENCLKGQNTTSTGDETLICETSLLNPPVGECKFNPSGRDYRGVENVTASGKTCLLWTETTGLMMNFDNNPGDSEGNFCRNPDPYSVVGPWCFHGNSSDSREICGVPTCDGFYTNVAYKGEVFSKPVGDYSALVDGSVLPVSVGCSVTPLLRAPWWSVKLTSRSKIYSVVVTTCDSPLDHLVIGVTDDPDSATNPNLGVYDVVRLFPGRINRYSSVSAYLERFCYGSYVIVQKLFALEMMSALEVQVMGISSETVQPPEFPLVTLQNTTSEEFYNYTWKDLGSYFSRSSLVGRSEVKTLEECMTSCLTSYGEECLGVQYAPVTSECWPRVGTEWLELSTDLNPWPNIRQYALYVRCPLFDPTMDIQASSAYTTRYTVEVKCNHGYQFLGQKQFTMSCLSNGTWSPEFSNCSIVTCPNISSAEFNFTSNTTDVIFETSTALSCPEGHRFSTNGNRAMVVTCLESGTWDAEIPSACEVIRCPQLNLTSSNVTSSSLETLFNTNVELICHLGHSFDGKITWKRIICLEDGGWNDSVITCQETRCTVYLEQLNITSDHPETTSFLFNSTQRFVCLDGYKISANNETIQNSTCSDVGAWSPELVPCVEISCTPPSFIPENVTMTTTLNENSYPLRHTLLYQCNPGTWLPGNGFNQSSTCTSPGLWSPEPISCEEFFCPPPPLIPGASLTDPSVRRSTYQYLSWAEYLCDPGTKLENGAKLQNLTCSEFGEWHPVPSICSDIHCPTLDKNGNYTLTSNDTVRGSVVTLACIEGYRMSDLTTNRTLECLDSEIWSEPVEDCLIVQCQDLNSAQNNYLLSDSDTSYLTNVILTCHLGYMFRDGSLQRNVTCKSDGSWDRTVDSCIEIVCPFLAVLPNTVIINDIITMTSFPFSTVIGYKCKPGTRLDSGETNQNLTCGGLGVWLPLVPQECKDVHCPALNRTTSNYSLSSFENVRSTSVNLTCAKGHAFPGGQRNMSAICLDSGDWSINISDCSPVSCPILESVDSNFAVDSTTRIYRSVVNVVCKPGFQFPDNTTWKTIVCTSAQLWNWTTPYCQRINCSGLPPIRNAIYRFSNGTPPLLTNETYSFDYNTTLTLECLYGFNLYNNKSILQKTSCLGLGEWLPAPMNCTDVYCPTLNTSGTYTLSSNVSIRRSVVVANCLVGFVFRGGAKKKNVTCTDAGMWSDPLEQCITVTCPTLNPVGGNYTVSSNDSRYNSMVSISCLVFNAFPDGRTYKQVVCLDSGNWSEEIGQCLWVWCTAPIAPGELTLLDSWQPSYQMYSKLRYRCQVGTKLANNLQDQMLECLGTGTWNPPAFARCQDVLCPSLSSISNVAVDTVVTKYKTQVRITCPDYMLFQNRKFQRNITCLENGSWNETDILCAALYCPSINITTTLTINTTATMAGTVVQVRCQDQSTFPDGSVMKYVTCGRYGNWSDSSLICRDFVRCPTLATPSHCTSALFVSRKVEMVVLTCDIGFLFRFGGRSRTMMCVDGRWSGYSSPMCMPKECLTGAEVEIISVDKYLKISRCVVEGGVNICDINPSATACLLKDSQCGGFPSLKNATVILDTQNKSLSVKCHLGYRFPDGTTELFVDCEHVDENVDQVSDCQIITCPPLIGSKLTLSSTSSVFNSSVDVTCWNRHAFPDGRTFVNVVCLISGLWSEPITSCMEVFCGAPLPFSGSYYLEKVAYPTYPMNQEFTLQCKGELRFEDGSTNLTLTCGSLGAWVPSGITCAPARCEPVPLVDHGVPSTNLSLSGTIVKYTCLPGYESTNPLAYYHCDGTNWVIQQPITCKEVVCGDLLTTNAALRSDNGNTFDVIVTVECNTGYRYRGQQTVEVRCLESATWSLAEVKCIPVDCDAPPEVTKGFLTLPPSFTSTYLDTITYTCFDGYWYARGRTKEIVTCSEDGLWVTDPTKLKCNPITCLPITSASLNSTSVTYGSVVSLTCPSTTNTTWTSTCSISGTWLPTPIRCAPPERREQRSVSEASHSDIIGIVSISIIVFVLFIIFLLDLPTIARHVRQNRWLRRLKNEVNVNNTRH